MLPRTVQPRALKSMLFVSYTTSARRYTIRVSAISAQGP